MSLTARSVRPRPRTRLAAVLTVVLAVVLATVLGAVAAQAGTAVTRTFWAVDKPLCPQPANPDVARCFALQRVQVAKGTPGAVAYHPSAMHGVAGGYSPWDLAKAYRYDPDASAAGQLVAIVDWYDDPTVGADLATFDRQYGLARETSSSFRKVNEAGHTSPLPQRSTETSGEIALDVEAVRGVCHRCRILLVEASTPSDADISRAEDRAVAMGATEISNSYGESEKGTSAAMSRAFDHPGVIITAATGDDGWFDWDFGNDPRDYSGNAAEFPSTSPDVVAVGGTTLNVGSSGARSSETVWNGDGNDDVDGWDAEQGLGAGGGGCSANYGAWAFQTHYPGYPALGCNGKRAAADISVVADPATGFDTYSSYDDQGWATIGGTSLASPVVAAMWALAGGAYGNAYPDSTLYVNGTHRASSFYDVTAGGNGFCGGDDTSSCSSTAATDAAQEGVAATNNPNALGAGNLDCSFPRSGASVTSAPAKSPECNATTGYDGPSGLGTPNGLGVFARTSPSVWITHGSVLRLHSAQAFVAHVTEHIAGARAIDYTWTWGDGSKPSTGSAPHHTYTRAGRYTVTLRVTDSLDQNAVRYLSLAVGLAPTARFSGQTSLKHDHPGTYRAAGSHSNDTGARVTSVTWHWGDGSGAKQATVVQHTYRRAGRYKLTETVSDSAGTHATLTRYVTVR